MRTLTLSPEDYATIRDALSYAAEDLAERETYEEKHGDPDGEAAEYREAIDKYADLAERLDRMVTNHYAVQVDGMTMASGPGDADHAEGMRAIYADINPGAEVTVILSRCDANPHGPCAAHEQDYANPRADDFDPRAAQEAGH